MRFKQLDHKWLVRNTPELFEEHATHSKLPIVPTVIQTDHDGSVIRVMQDSTPIMEQLEREFSDRSLSPPSASLRFISELMEEFADEWANKWMMHYRWYAKTSKPDAATYSRRIAVELNSGTREFGDTGVSERVSEMAEMFKSRMEGRGFTVGSNEVTAAVIEGSFRESLILLDLHLSTREYLLGARPSMADFGLAGQLNQCLSDVTAGELMRLHAPNVALWAEKMVNPDVRGDFEPWSSLECSLKPFLSSQVSMFLKWSNANATAMAAGHKSLRLDLGGGKLWEQSLGGPQKYHAKSLGVLQGKYAALPESGLSEVNRILEGTRCLEYLQPKNLKAGSKL
eukprot:TRINITY_DN14901_c0_g1_i1.p1 TRINITY_DN14901_c0_g1~~TRINITY_DN14901_c0_g1_i1.p1  ORF type:complete len:341 (+),score=57.75 TRINITY_DN14901_c0_g1_i1:75-1097(+)